MLNTEAAGDESGALDLTAAQLGMWFAERLSSEYSVTIAHYLDIRDADRRLDIPLFCRVAADAGRDMESAFTRIVERDGIPKQIVDLGIDNSVKVIDLRDEPDPLGAANRWMRADYQARVDLREGCLVVSALLRVADDRCYWYTRAHHIAMDGYAALTSVRAVLDRYNAALRGTQYRPPARASLAELVADDTAYRTSSRRAADREHWRVVARDLPERVTLAGRSGTAPLAPHNVVVGTTMDRTMQRQCEEVAGQWNSSLAVLLTAAFSAYMARMAASDDVVLSLPVTGRATAKIKRGSGMVSNMLPIRARGVGEKSMRELVAQLQLEMTGVLRHQRYRFEDIRADAGLADSNAVSFGPVVNMMFFDQPIEIEGAIVDYQILSSGLLEDLRVNLYQASPGAALEVDFHGNPNLYTEGELGWHLRRFELFLRRLLHEPDVAVGQVDLLEEGEDVELIGAGEGLVVDRSAAGSHVLSDFMDSVRREPGAQAVISEDRAWTYEHLDEERRRFAARLRAAGVARGDRVVIALPRGIEQVVAIYAVVGLGAAYVPVDPTQPGERRAAIARSASARVVVDEAFVEAEFSAEAAGVMDDRPDIGALVGGGGDVAYVLFTSGSTGTPKGVAISHTAIGNRLRWMQDDHPIGPADVILYKTPTTFDVSVWELFWPLAHGARMVIARPDGHRDPEYLRELIDARGVTALHFVPAMLDVYVEVMDRRTALFGPSVRMVFTSGEALSRKLADRVLDRCSAEVVNLYGPTEAAVDVTGHRVRRAPGPVPIGTPVANTTVMVLDARLRPVPVGVAGELYLGGCQLAYGYVGRLDLTVERFVANPFGDSGSRLYRTGDLARWNSDGELEYLGRSDFQVKIRGQRIELGEIESVIGELAGVDGVAVLARHDLADGPTLIAYIRTNSDLTDGDIIAACRRRLPSHMIPAVVMVLDEFPTGPTGKLDRSRLPGPQVRPGGDGFIAPSSPVERAIAEVIGELTGIEAVGVRDNLFSLGMDSLKAARMVNRLRLNHGIRLELGQVFDAGDIARMAKAAGDRRREQSIERLRPVVPRPAVVPPSPAQMRLWFLNRLDPGSGTYNMPGAVRMGFDADLDAIAGAIVDVLTRHEALRTRFPSHGGEPIQEVIEPVDAAAQLNFDVIDHGRDAAEFIRSAASAGFDLAHEIPFRTTIVRDADGYVVLLVLHHIAGDGLSLTPLIRDLLEAYRARRSGEPGLPALAVQYADYALWQRELLGDEDAPTPFAQDGLRFWHDELAGLPPLLQLPTDRPRPHVASGAGAYVDTTVSGADADTLRALARRLQVTPFTVLHAALVLVLSRWSDAEDFAVGTAVSGREEPATEDMVGMFVNTVVLRTPISPYDTGAQLLRRAHATRARALAHASIPFEQVVDDVVTDRSSSYSPLFQVAITQYPGQGSVVQEALPGVRVLDVRPPSSKFDIAVSITDEVGGDGYAIEIAYATDLFDEQTIRTLANQMQAAVHEITATPDRPLGAIDLAPDVIAHAGASDQSTVAPQTMRQLFAQGYAQAQPDRPAISGAADLTWLNLEAQSNQLARELISRGVGPGQTVAICIPRSACSIIAMIAVAKSGAAFVNIDSLHPPSRRAEILSDSAAALGLTVSAVSEIVPGGVEWLSIDDVSMELRLAGHSNARVDDRELTRVPVVDDIAYLIYTSGSTGRPKAAAVSHRGLANMVANQHRLLGVDHRARVLHVASPSFDASIFEVTMALCVGGELVVSPPDVFGGVELAQLIARHRVTHVVMTPSALGTIDPAEVPGLRRVISVGETCPPELVRRWAGVGQQFFNLYGPTEATIWSTAAGPIGVDDALSIGPAVPGVGVLVLDRSLRPVASGLPGELYLTGPQLGVGYHGRSALTASRFVANPFEPGTRMYRTGDRVRVEADTSICYLGRTDFQLKIRGLRIEPGEVDAAVLTHPAVGEAVTLGMAGPGADDVLVTYVTLVGDVMIEASEILEHAARVLPGYLVPQTICIVDRFDLTKSGKIDRSRIRPVEFTQHAPYVAPRTQLEGVVSEVYGLVLHRERVSREADFFDLGGNSLSATKATSRLSAALDREVPVRLLFDHPTVAGLARELTRDNGAAQLPPLRARSHAHLVPISEMQRGMWLMNHADPSSPAYNVALALRLRGDLDLAALRTSLKDLMARHEPLRTVYPMVEGKPGQLVLPADSPQAELDLPIIRIATEDEQTGTEAGLAAAIAEVTGLGFDIDRQAPVRAALLVERPGEHVLVLVVHHISADGASMAPLARDLMLAYSARSAGGEPAWTPLTIQYADYSLWHTDHLARRSGDVSVREHQLQYWERRLAGAAALLDLPVDRPRPNTRTFDGAAVGFELPAELVTQLNRLARSSNATPFMVTQAAFVILLSKIAGRGDVVIGTPFANRGHVGLDDVVGMFVNTLALRTRVEPDEPFTTMLDRLRRDDLADMAHTDVAFDTVAARVVPRPPTSYNPVFQVVFAFQNIELPRLELGELTVAPVEEQLISAKVDLQLSLFANDPAGRSSDGAIRGEFIYATDIFDRSTIERISAWYVQVLETVAGEPETILADIDFGSGTHPADPVVDSTAQTAQGLSAAVAFAARMQPSDTAVERGGTRVTFADLDGMTEVMAAAASDRESALSMALVSLIPALAVADADEFGDVLAELEGRSEEAIGYRSADININREGDNRT